MEDPLRVRYRDAERLLGEEQTLEALDGFKAVYADAGGSTFAPKACFAVGWIYENVVVDPDSASAWYKRLIAEHPKSEYAGIATPKIAVMEDSTKLSQFVKIKEIAPIPRPVRKNFGLVPTAAPAGTLPPGIESDELDDDEYYQDEEEADPDEEEVDPDEEVDDEPPDPDPEAAIGTAGRAGTAGPGRGNDSSHGGR
jgi:hypothetical protein